MAGSNFSQVMQGIGGAAGVAGALADSYFNAPKAASNRPFLKRANQVGLWNYGASDMAGLMSQIENTPHLHDISDKTLHDPSGEEKYFYLLKGGAGAYAQMKNFTAPLASMGGSEASVGSASNHVDMDLMKNAATREEQFDIAEGAFNDMGLGETGKSLSVAAANQGYTPTPDYSELFPTGAPYAQPNMWMVGQQFGCGGHKHACGGHKYDWGGGLATGLNLFSGGLGIALNYIRQREEMQQAAMEATEANAANAYARQMNQHNQNIAINDTKNNMFRQQGLQMMAMGGDLQTQGSDFPLLGGYNVIGAGGTHEQNPFGGVYQGMAEDGLPNLVEEDEVVWNNYVFSNRIKIPASFADDYKLRDDMTFAAAAQKLAQEAEERPNDPISQNGLAASLGALMNSQEEVKAKREEAKMKRALSKMTPEELANILAAAQGEQFACGGHMHARGGWNLSDDALRKLFSPRYQASNGANYIPWLRDMTEETVLKQETDPFFKAWTKYVKANWDSDAVQKYLKALDTAAGGNHLFDKEGKLLAGAKDYFNNARTKNHKWGYYHLTPGQLAAVIEEEKKDEVKEGPKKEESKKKEPTDEEKAILAALGAPIEGSNDEVAALPTFLRYAPIVGSAIGTIAAHAPAKDYSTSVAFRTPHYAPIGDYLPYLPIDTQRYINAENQQAAAQLNAIMNASAGNRNMAMSQAALANQQRQQGIGQRMQAAEQINWDRLRTAGEFNRGTNMFNAQAHNAAELAALQNNPLLLRQAQQNMAMKHAADSERDAAISQSLNALFDNLGDLGRENLTWNQINSNNALDYFANLNGISGYKGACGGRLTSKKRR